MAKLHVVIKSTRAVMLIYGVILVFVAAWGVWMTVREDALSPSGVAIVRAQSAGVLQPQPLTGFWWTDGFGWISMNCRNDWNGDDLIALPMEDRCATQGAYGVQLQFDPIARAGELSGRAWSPNAGVMCIGRTCAADRAVTFDLDALTPVATREGGTEELALLQGFGRFEALSADNQGWFDFRGNDQGAAIPRPLSSGGSAVRCDEMVETDADTGVRSVRLQCRFTGTAWQINADGTGAGWVFVGAAPPGISAADAEPETETGQEERQYPARDQLCTSRLDTDDDDGRNSPNRDISIGGACDDYDCAVNAARRAEREALGCPTRESGALCFDGVDNDLNACGWSTAVGQYALLGAATVCPTNTTPGGRTVPGIDCGDASCSGAVDPATGRRCIEREFLAGRYNFCHDVDAQGQPIDNDGNGPANCQDPACSTFVTCIPLNLLQGVHPKCRPGGEFYDADITCATECADPDRDGVCNIDDGDNCPEITNPDQADINDNKIGDSCDAWLQTSKGSIYARSIQGIPPPREAGVYTATYCILTSGAPVPAGFVAPDACPLPNLNLDAHNLLQEFRLLQYSDSVAVITDTIRARLNTRGLREERFGRVEVLQGSTLDIGTIATPASIAVYYYNGAEHGGAPLRIINPSDAAFENSILRGQRAARLILVEGADIIIEGNLRYAPAVDEIQNIASIGIAAIGGDIAFDSAVEHAVGTILTTGFLRTGESDSPFDLEGLLVARQFEFGRTFASQSRGAERIEYDGRAVLNAPPGFADFIKTLPRFRATAP